MNKTILITGGTGLIGSAITRQALARGYRVIILTRQPQKHTPGHPRLSYAGWDLSKQYIDPAAPAAADYIIHLAGAGVAEKRWSKQRKQEIVDSRVDSGRLLVKALGEYPNEVKAVISSSAIGWYGPDQPTIHPAPFVETDAADHAFLGDTCAKWEAAIQPVTGLGKRLVLLRTGIVLSAGGGAFREFVKPLRFGLATILGTGKQVVSWIHMDDLVNLFFFAIEKETWQGAFNAVAPQPVSNRELILQLARSRGRLFLPVRVPEWVLKLMLGEMSIEVLKSATVSSAKIQSAGFQFTYPGIREAMDQLCGKQDQASSA